VTSSMDDCCRTTGGQPSTRMLSSGLSCARHSRSTQICTDLQQQGSNLSSSQEDGNGHHWSIAQEQAGSHLCIGDARLLHQVAKAIPLKGATAKSVAGVLLSVILTWGPPVELLSNQGLEFVAELNCKLSRQWMECGTQETLQMAFRLVGGGESSGFPMEFQSPYSGNSSRR